MAMLGKRIRIAIVLAVMMSITLTLSYTSAGSDSNEDVELPAWRPGNIWQYNMSILSKPGHQTATINVARWGKFIADDGTEYPTFSSYCITRINQTDETYGYIYTRVQDMRSIIRENYSIAFSDKVTHINKGGEEYIEYNNITRYKPMLDSYMFPIEMGEVWEQSTMLNTSSVLYEWVEEGDNWVKNKVSETSFYTNVTFYYNCTGAENVEVSLVINWDDYIDNKSVTWNKQTFNALRIKQDNESQDSDGCYIVEYWSEDVGNIVKKEIFKEGELYSTWSLIYYEYPTTWISQIDSDDDGLWDCDEYYYGTDPHNPDTDGDGLMDGEEIWSYGTDPLVYNSPAEMFLRRYWWAILPIVVSSLITGSFLVRGKRPKILDLKDLNLIKFITLIVSLIGPVLIIIGFFHPIDVDYLPKGRFGYYSEVQYLHYWVESPANIFYAGLVFAAGTLALLFLILSLYNSSRLMGGIALFSLYCCEIGCPGVKSVIFIGSILTIICPIHLLHLIKRFKERKQK